MKKAIAIIVLGLLICNTNFTTVEAKSYNLDRATGDCKLTENLFPTMSYDVYKNTFINLKLDFKFKTGATYVEGGLLKNWYWIETRFREAAMACLKGDSQICDKIVQHVKHLSENKALQKNYGGPKDDDWYEATFINNHALSHVLFAYWVAKQKIAIDEKTDLQIAEWAKIAVKRNSVSRRKELNNHSLNSAKAFVLAGSIWNDDKTLSKGEKIFKKYLDKEFKIISNDYAVLPPEAKRGSRALYYTGRTINVMFFLAALLSDAGRDQYDEKFHDKINKAVNFFLDADIDNSLIYPWAKKNKSAFGDYKKQIRDHTTYAWIPAYLYLYKDSKLLDKISSNKNIKQFFANEKNTYNKARWTLIDSKCVYSGKWMKKGKNETAAAKYRTVVKNKTDNTILIKAEGPTKEIAEKEAMKICIGKSVQSSFKDACYVHYSGEIPRY